MAAFFKQELEGVATYWRIYRRDGITQGFTSHDRDLMFDGITHCAAPGMQPTSIRRTDSLSSDDAEVKGALSHDSISEDDLAAGLYDHARIEIGAVDWTSYKREVFYTGNIGQVEVAGSAFGAELLSAKAALDKEFVPRTSPTCRAEFCGKECGVSSAQVTQIVTVNLVDLDTNSVEAEFDTSNNFVDGEMRFLDGPQTGMAFGIVAAQTGTLTLDRPLHANTKTPCKALLREGCDHTIETCTGRFANAANFRGEPFLPGNDLLARYPIGR